MRVVAPGRQRSSRVAGGAVVLTLLACGGGQATAPPGPARGGTGARADATSVTFFGYRLGASREELRARHPEVPAAGESVVLERVVGGVPTRVTLHLHAARLWSIGVEVPPASASVAAYRRLQATVRGETGAAGRATRCESDRGVPLEEDIASGDGLLETTWRAPPVVAQLHLSRDDGVPGAMRIHGFVTDGSLGPPCESGDSICGAPIRTSPSAPRARGRARGVPATADAALLASPPAAATCSAAAAGAPRAALLGLTFGATRAEAEAALGRALRELGGGVVGLDTEVAGVPGRLVLHFYGECLAVVMFVVEGAGATPAEYDALLGWARSSLGPGSARRCMVEGAGTPPVVGATDRLDTRWRGAGPLAGDLRFEADDAVPGPGSPARIVFEAEHEALRPFAPHIDFADR